MNIKETNGVEVAKKATEKTKIFDDAKDKNVAKVVIYETEDGYEHDDGTPIERDELFDLFSKGVIVENEDEEIWKAPVAINDVGEFIFADGGESGSSNIKVVNMTAAGDDFSLPDNFDIESAISEIENGAVYIFRGKDSSGCIVCSLGVTIRGPENGNKAISINRTQTVYNSYEKKIIVLAESWYSHQHKDAGVTYKLMVKVTAGMS